ncbi:MAG: hypothetical protein ABIL69_00385 [candidate division WOR-3 bacterium]
MKNIASEIFGVIAGAVALFALFDLANFLKFREKEKKSLWQYISISKIRLVVWVIGVGVLIIFCLYLTISDILPVVKTGDSQKIFYSITGYIIIIIGILIMFYGAVIFLHDTIFAFTSADSPITQGVPEKEKNKFRWGNAKYLLKLWRKSFIIILVGFAVALIGAHLGYRLGGL